MMPLSRRMDGATEEVPQQATPADVDVSGIGDDGNMPSAGERMCMHRFCAGIVHRCAAALQESTVFPRVLCCSGTL
jgi:hypothetical protein